MPITEQERHDRYWEAQRDYRVASEYADQVKRALNRQEDLKSNAGQKKKDAESLKSWLKQRLRQVKEIIGTLESGNVPKALDTADKNAKKADNRFHEAIHVYGIMESANLSAAYGTRTIQDNRDSNAALCNLRLEKQSLENRICEQERRICELEQEIMKANKLIENYSDQLRYYLKEIQNAEDEMFTYRRYRYV